MRWWIQLVAGLGCLLWAAAAVAAPVDLLLQDSQVFLRPSGAADVIYSLTFRDNEGRSYIREVGPFYHPMHINRAWLLDGETKREITFHKSGDSYQARFTDFKTRAGATYTMVMHYRANHRFADPTQAAGGEALAAVWFNPPRWGMPIARSVIKLVLPLELPAEVRRHEDITPAMVQALGLQEVEENKKAQDHYALVYTDHERKRRLTIYAERKKLAARAPHLLKTYVPQSAFPVLSSGKDVEASGAAEAELLTSRGQADLVEEAYTIRFQGPGLFAFRSRLTMQERGARNFVPVPDSGAQGGPVDCFDKDSREMAPTCEAWLDGEAVACEPGQRALILAKASEAGQRLEVAFEKRCRLMGGSSELVECGDTDCLPVRVVAVSEQFGPRDKLRSSTFHLLSGQPLPPGTPTDRPLSGPGPWPVHFYSQDAESASLELSAQKTNWTELHFSHTQDYPEYQSDSPEFAARLLRRKDLTSRASFEF